VEAATSWAPWRPPISPARRGSARAGIDEITAMTTTLKL
jgi:hypothetical protein